MNRVIKKLHMYLGLLVYTNLVVFGIAGLMATFQPAPEKRPKAEPVVGMASFTAPLGLSDKELADRAYASLKLPLTAPLPKFALRRDGNQNLLLNFYTVNGIFKVTVLEKENQLRIETERNSIGHYLDNLHSMTINARSDDWRVRLWAYYNEVAIWSLIALALSGIYLGLSSRPWYRPALYALAAGGGIFILLYILTR